MGYFSERVGFGTGKVRGFTVGKRVLPDLPGTLRTTYRKERYVGVTGKVGNWGTSFGKTAYVVRRTKKTFRRKKPFRKLEYKGTN